MKSRNRLLVIALASALTAPAFAQTTAQDQAKETQRDATQQERIEQGLKSGQLNSKEAGKLEREENRVDKMESRAARNGSVSPEEQRRIDAAQNKVSKDIYAQKHDAQKGNPAAASSQRMQSDVQRNVNQEKRIEQGVKSGELTTKEAGRMERGEAATDRAEAKAGASGRVSAREQRRIARAETRQSKRIHKDKTNDKTAQ